MWHDPNGSIPKPYMKNLPIIITVIAAASITFTAKCIEPKEIGYNTINRPTAEAHISFLAADELEGREAGYKSGRIAGNYVEAQLKALGLIPWDDKNFFQPFDAYRVERQKKGQYTVHPDSVAKIIADTHHQKLSLRNVMGKITGKKPDEIVVIGAHYDHLGLDPLLDTDKIYNGADDNASGVAAVLQIARAFVTSGVQPERTIIFALWDGEEKGLLGSEYFMQTFSDPKKIKGYLNFDMIGRNNKENVPEHVVYLYTAGNPIFETWLKNDIAQRGLKLKPHFSAWKQLLSGSDNRSFAKRNIPIIWYHTDGHPDYHLPSDHTDKINWEKTVDITRAAYLNLWNLANEKTY